MANTHRDFRVRKSVVDHALQWLLANNRYYLNVRINVDALALLPEDGNLNRLHCITLDSTIDDPELLYICTERGPLRCPPFSFFRPQHQSADD